MYINTVKSVNAVNYYLYESYRNEKGQSRSRIVEKLGNVDEIKKNLMLLMLMPGVRSTLNRELLKLRKLL